MTKSPPMPAPSLSQINAALLYSQHYWSGPQVSYSAPTGVFGFTGYQTGEETTDPRFAVLSQTQNAAFQQLMELYDTFIALELSPTTGGFGQIRVAFTDVGAQIEGEETFNGYAYSPPSLGGVGAPRNGDVWIDYSFADDEVAPGDYLQLLFLHEVGHALGLAHPFADEDEPAKAVLSVEYDNARYTVMAYEPYLDRYHTYLEVRDGSLWRIGDAVAPTTPMVFDIAALQHRYGADPNTRSGDDIYSWSQDKPLMQALYDAGGVDTFDLSGHTRGSRIDLTPGAYSSIAYFSAQDQLAYWTALHPSASAFIGEWLDDDDTYTWSDNLGIAYSTTVENVHGGAGADTVFGNAAANVLSGAGGRDRLMGAGGDDSLSGGADEDFLRGEEGDDVLEGGALWDDMHGNMGSDTLYGGDGGDWVVGGKDPDLLFGEAGDDLVYGNIGADSLSGGAGADRLLGGQDNDTLMGGDDADFLSGDRGEDLLWGGAGADTFYAFNGSGGERVMDFNRAEGDQVRIDPGLSPIVSEVADGVAVSLAGGGRMVLVGVTLASLTGDWLSIL